MVHRGRNSRLKGARLYSIVARRNSLVSSGSVVPTVHFATWRSLPLTWHFKFGSISNGKMGNRKSKRTFSFAKNSLASRYERFLRWASCHLGENESQHRLRLGGSVGRLA